MIPALIAACAVLTWALLIVWARGSSHRDAAEFYRKDAERVWAQATRVIDQATKPATKRRARPRRSK